MAPLTVDVCTADVAAAVIVSNLIIDVSEGHDEVDWKKRQGDDGVQYGAGHGPEVTVDDQR